MYVIDSPGYGAGLGLAEPSPHIDDLLGQGPNLRRFTPEEVFLSEEAARNVLSFFFPSQGLPSQITIEDRAFAQALLIEAIQRSHDMSYVKAIFDTSYMKIPGSPRAVIKQAVKLGLKFGWLSAKRKKLDPEKAKIYKSVRVTLSRNFKTPWTLRLATGELLY